MTASSAAAEHGRAGGDRPRLRPEVRVGPPLLEGDRVVHVVGDRDTGAFLRVGEREAFLLSRLGGEGSLAEIGADYARRFGRRLSTDHWDSLLATLAGRGLLVGADPALLERVRVSAEAARRARGRSLLRWRLPLRGAVDLVPAVARAVGWMLAPLVAVPLTLAGAAVCGYAVLHWRELYAALTQASPLWSVSLVAVLAVGVVLCAHEFGHGVACHRYGGRPTEIGLMWRLPLVALYCKTDEQVLFPRARQRVVTSFAGVYVNLVALLPMAALWWWGPGDGWWHGLAGALLLFGTVAALANLLPVLGLDGYHMLGHALSTMHLQEQTLRFAGRLLSGRGVGGYPARARVVYSGYALLAALILGSAAGGVLTVWYRVLAGLWSPLGAILVLVAEGVLVVLLAYWFLRRRREA